ncbi:MAG: nucleotide excision repair endonuclease [Fibrobacter sp.]|nr:nucleotide excision repair endonuclease [Fibrobacter sp.]
MHEEMIEYLKNTPEGVTSAVLAELFLKIKNANNTFTHTAITSILSKDKRCYIDKDGLWHIKLRPASDGEPFESEPLRAVFLISHPSDTGRKILYAALWEIVTEPRMLWNRWLVDSENQLASDQKFLLTGSDTFTPLSHYDTELKTLTTLLSEVTPVYFSSYEHTALRSACYSKNIILNDDAIYVTDLLSAAKIEFLQPVSPVSCAKELFGTDITFQNVHRQGEQFTSCILELLRQIKTQGIETREDFDKINIDEISRFLEGKSYTFEQIYSLPQSEGIYGFKDKNGSYLYIGRTGNLKRKITGFFRDINAVSGKLRTLLSQSDSLITHPCGSELESSLYEYRLIGKYTPSFNSKPPAHDLKNRPASTGSHIIIQPHISDSKIVAFLIHEQKKIIIRSIDVPSGFDNKLLQEIQTFFFEPGAQTEKSDPFESQIVYPWIQHQADSIAVIPVHNFKDGSEVLRFMKTSIPF